MYDSYSSFISSWHVHHQKLNLHSLTHLWSSSSTTHTNNMTIIMIMMQSWICKLLLGFKLYSSMACINWMFVEGLLLHTKLSGVFSEGPPFPYFYLIGWGELVIFYLWINNNSLLHLIIFACQVHFSHYFVLTYDRWLFGIDLTIYKFTWLLVHSFRFLFFIPEKR